MNAPPPEGRPKTFEIIHGDVKRLDTERTGGHGFAEVETDTAGGGVLPSANGRAPELGRELCLRGVPASRAAIARGPPGDCPRRRPASRPRLPAFVQRHRRHER